MACKQAVRLCDDACGFDENRRETRKVYDTLPRSVSAPEPCDAVLARLGTRIWTALVQLPQRCQFGSAAHDGKVRHSHTHGSRRTARAPAL